MRSTTLITCEPFLKARNVRNVPLNVVRLSELKFLLINRVLTRTFLVRRRTTLLSDSVRVSEVVKALFLDRARIS